jgi:tetratricopeptide (TPR) repeat protein
MFMKDTGGEAAFVECPSCGALALPAGDNADDALSRALSGPQDVPAHLQQGGAQVGGHGLGSLETQAEQAPVAIPSIPSDASGEGASAFSDPRMQIPNTGAGVFSGLLAAQGASASGPQAKAPGDAAPGGVDFDFGKDVDLDFDKHMPSSPSVSSLPRTFTPKAGAPRGPVTTPPRGNVHARPDGLQHSALGPGGHFDDEESDTGVGKPAPWTGLSDEAFGDLEKAFDEMALRPGAAPARRGGGGLTADEEEFLRGDRPARDKKPPTLPRGGDDGPTGRREAPAKPPPRRGTKTQKQRPPHLTLSDEAKKLAFLPLRADPKPDTSGAVARPKLDAVAPKLEVKARGQRGHDLDEGVGVGEHTDVVRDARKDKPVARVVPSPFRGLSFVRVAALVLVAAMLGGALGFFLTTKPQRANTPRARAELKFANGNRFYDQGRFDDALGEFKGAIGSDGTFAIAYRAKGAALAKLQRFDEAAEAYKKYLELEPNAVDVADVTEAIKRRETVKPP